MQRQGKRAMDSPSSKSSKQIAHSPAAVESTSSEIGSKYCVRGTFLLFGHGTYHCQTINLVVQRTA